MKAVVAKELNRIEIAQVDLAPPRASEVQVAMRAVGVCHSDLSAAKGDIPHPLPVVLGHEGAGVVEAVGDGVSHVKPGDHVVMSFMPSCRRCFHCVRGESFLCLAMPNAGQMTDGTSRLLMSGKPLAAFCSLGVMAERAVCSAASVVPIPNDVPFEAAALTGCAVATGVGAVIHTAQMEVGSTVAVFGCGGVGIAAIQGARIAGASRIFAIARQEAKLELAKRFGATDLVRAEDAVNSLLGSTEGLGVDLALEAAGHPKVLEAALAATRRGGTTVAIGVGKMTETINLNALMFPLSGKTLRGCLYGSANPLFDFPNLLNLYRSGRLDLDGMVTRKYTIDQAPKAFEDLERGANVRGVITFS